MLDGGRKKKKENYKTNLVPELLQSFVLLTPHSPLLLFFLFQSTKKLFIFQNVFSAAAWVLFDIKKKRGGK